ncbi:MAG: hypothetical protein D6694_13920 [Gammaproteobacteria bacterium]|nr:MAG: hypothetical protein D6694_13920 [Gammaproteobacteria bacterium]
MSVDAPKGDTAAIRKAVVKNVGKHIASSFKTQSEQLGLFVPEFMVDESAYSTIIIDAIVPYPVRPHESEVGRWLMAVNATMSVQARIPSGAWAVGRMLSRGKGIITRTRSAA